jgi:hypothetical protein
MDIPATRSARNPDGIFMNFNRILVGTIRR